ncbi:ABC transporter ATP-binding protein [Streptomyces sp. NPDC090085]|uniref:ATP-binding cassette domain-containing protein n=1 Tax=Streptomyces sp. NPDC090085 TaxID=3365943 RepID=UPI003812B59F
MLDSRASGVENWQAALRSLLESDCVPNGIVLKDEPFGSLRGLAEHRLFDVLLQLADKGFQLIIASVETPWVALLEARVIKIASSVRRPASLDPTKLPEGPTLLITHRFR